VVPLLGQTNEGGLLGEEEERRMGRKSGDDDHNNDKICADIVKTQLALTWLRVDNSGN
jgi:hypothetical protein